ncbi:MAG: transposase [Caldilineaceae bacterium]|nr:transposase [Caldilineaceae bacterium]
MFRENTAHQQRRLISTLDDLPAGVREMLEASWAGVFYREVFSRLDERPFEVLYSSQASRPNVPVNVLVGLEILKAGFGWTDEELYHHFMFDLQVRYAVGYEQLGDGYLSIRTIYEFRGRLSKQMQETGENLLEAAFAQVTDEQIEALALRTDKLRMDSTQIAGHIRRFGRLQLLVEVLQRVERILVDEDRERYAEQLASYTRSKAGHYVHRVKSDETESHLTAIGYVMAQLVTELAEGYEQEPVYQMLVRVFTEHFVWQEEHLFPKAAAELSSTSLQAPDDPEATFRRKRGKSYRGYVANVTETCNPDNELQLIVQTQTEPNVTDDGQMLADAVPDLVARTEVDTLHTDGGYTGPETDRILAEAEIDHKPSAIRGAKPSGDKLSLADFECEFDDQGNPVALTCPEGERFAVEPGRTEERFIARPDDATCAGCPLLARCPVRPAKSHLKPVLYFDKRAIEVAAKRRQIAASPPGQPNLRAAVEATVRSLKHPFRHGKLLVRGKFRIACQIIASAMMVNLRRIHQYRKERTNPLVSLIFSAIFLLQRLLQSRTATPHFFSHQSVLRSCASAMAALYVRHDSLYSKF